MSLYKLKRLQAQAAHAFYVGQGAAVEADQHDLPVSAVSIALARRR